MNLTSEKKNRLIKIILFIGYLFLSFFEDHPAITGLSLGGAVAGSLVLGHPIIALVILIPIVLVEIIAFVLGMASGITLLWHNIKEKYNNFEDGR